MEEMAVVNSAVCSVSPFGCVTVLPNSQSKMTPSVPSPCPLTKLLLPKSFLCFLYVTTHPITQTLCYYTQSPGCYHQLWPVASFLVSLPSSWFSTKARKALNKPIPPSLTAPKLSSPTFVFLATLSNPQAQGYILSF